MYCLILELNDLDCFPVALFKLRHCSDLYVAKLQTPLNYLKLHAPIELIYSQLFSIGLEN